MENEGVETLTWREVDLGGVVLAGLAAGYVMALAGLWSAGMWRYGFRRAAARLFRGVLDAACAFEDDPLPELFCGFDRSMGPPVPYVEANVPQAWAAATPVFAAQTLLGVVPDAPSGRCHVATLPRGCRNGCRPWRYATLWSAMARSTSRLSGTARRRLSSGVRGRGVDVVQGHVAAPLWGRPHPHRTTVRRRV